MIGSPFPKPLLWVLVLVLSACSGPDEEGTQGTDQSTAEQAPAQVEQQPPTADSKHPGTIAGPDGLAIAANNRGVGLMGRFEYTAAREVFARLAERYPDWREVRINLAIATLNRQEEGDEEQALGLADQVLAADPDNLRAHYVAGLLRLYLASPKEALSHFQRVAQGDPTDAYAAYYLGQCLAQQSDYEQALHWYQQAMQLDPYLRSAYYGAFQAQQRLRRRDEARRLVKAYQRLAGNPRAHLAEFKYTRMGPKGDAMAIDLPRPTPPPAPPNGPLFAPPEPLPLVAGASLPQWSIPPGVGITVVDLDADGHLDLYIPSPLADGGPSLLLHGHEDGRFEPDPRHPLAAATGVNAALWGDYDNDGLVDVYLCRNGANQLWRQHPAGTWQDVTASTGTAGGELDTRDGAFIDADHDGDLDLFLVNGDGPSALLNNDLNGSFHDIAAEQGIAGDGRPARQVLAADLDADRDLDLVVLYDQPPHAVYLNDRLWQYHPAEGFDAFTSAPLRAALAVDLDADGRPELYGLAGANQLLRWTRGEDGVWGLRTDTLEVPISTAEATMLFQDVDGDGVQELLYTTQAGWAVVRVGQEAQETLYQADAAGLRGLAPLLLQPERGAALLALGDEGLRLWPAGGGRYGFLTLSLSGKEDSGQSMRSNASGIGARVAVRVDSRWSIQSNPAPVSAPGQGLQPLSIGLGGAEQADFVAIDWPDGVFQSELDLAAGSTNRINETQRQLSSCPVLFAWDGERYAFVTDLLGVGGMGYAIGRGEYATPRPWENILLQPGQLRPEDGRYRLKLSEPMEETMYLDAARLVAYDLPPGWHMVLDERMSILGPEPSGKPLYYRRQLLPSKALDRDGNTLTETITARDGKAAPVGPLDHRFIGRLAGEQVLTLEFSEPLDAPAGTPVLMVDGWVEYPYSQTMFAAWQAGAGYDAPTLEARAADGTWKVIYEQFGYPAGMPRRMALPLPELPPGTTGLRLRTNMQVYWDRIAVAYAEPMGPDIPGADPTVQRTVLPLTTARVAKTGFALRTTAPQFRPHYDYQRRAPFWDARYMEGFYTRVGPALDLVKEWDDAVAIVGAGDEIHLEFLAPDQAPPPGWRRQLVLETNGWSKDMDLYTRDGETVGPLPTSGRAGPKATRLHAAYNTRFQGGW